MAGKNSAWMALPYAEVFMRSLLLQFLNFRASLI